MDYKCINEFEYGIDDHIIFTFIEWFELIHFVVQYSIYTIEMNGLRNINHFMNH